MITTSLLLTSLNPSQFLLNTPLSKQLRADRNFGDFKEWLTAIERSKIRSISSEWAGREKDLDNHHQRKK